VKISIKKFKNFPAAPRPSLKKLKYLAKIENYEPKKCTPIYWKAF
jgi:hypothetical protein